MLEYKSYSSNPIYEPEDKIYYGKIEGIKDLVDYHAESLDNIEEAFKKCVDEYIAFCKEIEKTPDTPML